MQSSVLDKSLFKSIQNPEIIILTLIFKLTVAGRKLRNTVGPAYSILGEISFGVLVRK